MIFHELKIKEVLQDIGILLGNFFIQNNMVLYNTIVIFIASTGIKELGGVTGIFEHFLFPF